MLLNIRSVRIIIDVMFFCTNPRNPFPSLVPHCASAFHCSSSSLFFCTFAFFSVCKPWIPLRFALLASMPRTTTSTPRTVVFATPRASVVAAPRITSTTFWKTTKDLDRNPCLTWKLLHLDVAVAAPPLKMLELLSLLLDVLPSFWRCLSYCHRFFVCFVFRLHSYLHWKITITCIDKGQFLQTSFITLKLLAAFLGFEFWWMC